LSIFVAIAGSGGGNRIMSSPDGITWTSQISPNNYEWDSICWSSKLRMFAAVADIPTTGTDHIMTSAVVDLSGEPGDDVDATASIEELTDRTDELEFKINLLIRALLEADIPLPDELVSTLD
jgi:hypothetical protein